MPPQNLKSRRLQKIPKGKKKQQKTLFSLSLSLSRGRKTTMEAMLVDCVHNSLRHFVYKNAIFMCERLCAEFPSEVPSSFTLFLFISLSTNSVNRSCWNGKIEIFGFVIRLGILNLSYMHLFLDLEFDCFTVFFEIDFGFSPFSLCFAIYVLFLGSIMS